jgi:hypothetical protein
MYEKGFLMGYAGVFGWSAQGVDENGSLATCTPATTATYEKHKELIDGGQNTAATNQLRQAGPHARLSAAALISGAEGVLRVTPSNTPVESVRILDLTGRQIARLDAVIPGVSVSIPLPPGVSMCIVELDDAGMQLVRIAHGR